MRIAVIGSNSSSSDTAMEKLAFDLGLTLVNNGHTIFNGGMDGTMSCLAQGARASENYRDNSVVAILPLVDEKLANPYSSLTIRTDMGTARNRLIVLNGDVVIAIGGGAGTLNEIALAWEFGKPIAAFRSVGGWSAKVAGTQIDARRADVIHSCDSVEDVLQWLNGLNLE